MEDLNVIIADDEAASREIIRNYLDRYCDGLKVVAEAADAKQAIEAIQKHPVDLLFLDVEMPYGNAFDVLEASQQKQFQTIFITAFSNYAIKALNYSAAYYILKPISIEELIAAVDKVKANHQQQDGFAELKKVLLDNFKSDSIQRIVLPNQSGFEIVNADEIIRISGSGNYSDLYLKNGKKKTVSKVLKYFADLEEQGPFMRVHKSHIINLSYIKAYQKGRGGVLLMQDQAEVEVSPNKKQALLQRLGL